MSEEVPLFCQIINGAVALLVAAVAGATTSACHGSVEASEISSSTPKAKQADGPPNASAQNTAANTTVTASANEKVATSPPASGGPIPAASTPNTVASSLVAAGTSTGELNKGETPPNELKCTEGEVYIPPTGEKGFAMGRADGGTKDTHRTHNVVLTRGFCLDSNEVTAAEYEKCVAAKVCKKAWVGDPWASYSQHPDYPINMVSWEKSRKYCEWAGKRLPSEAEWEWAATGPEGSKYPWGQEAPTCEHADYTAGGAPKWSPGGDWGCHGGGPSKVGGHPKGDKTWPGGVLHDMAGNVWEWVEDSYATQPTTRQVDPLYRDETALHVIKGGAWNRAEISLQGGYRAAANYRYQVPGLGFRCARGAPHPTPPPRRAKDGSYDWLARFCYVVCCSPRLSDSPRSR